MSVAQKSGGVIACLQMDPWRAVLPVRQQFVLASRPLLLLFFLLLRLLLLDC